MSDFFLLLLAEPALLAGLACVTIFIIYDAFTQKDMYAWLDRQSEPDKRLPLYNRTIRDLWALAGITIICWFLSGRDLQSLGFVHDPSPAYWIITALIVIVIAYLVWQVVSLRTFPKARKGYREQLAGAGDITLMQPETPAELRRFILLSITAGITEEIIFRGFLIGAFALWFPIWLAGLLASGLFIFAHAYQGIAGMVRLIPITLVFTILFIVSGSLWPVIVLHIVIDITSGLMLNIVHHHQESDQVSTQ